MIIVVNQVYAAVEYMHTVVVVSFPAGQGEAKPVVRAGIHARSRGGDLECLFHDASGPEVHNRQVWFVCVCH